MYLNRTRNSANFFSYVCKSVQLFASTLNKIPASVRCVSFIIVALNAKLTRLIAADANKKDSEKRKSPKRVPFFATFNFYRNLECAREIESIIYFPTIYAS